MNMLGTNSQRIVLVVISIGALLLLLLRDQEQQHPQQLLQQLRLKFNKKQIKIQNDNGLGKTPPMGWNSWNGPNGVNT